MTAGTMLLMGGISCFAVTVVLSIVFFVSGIRGKKRIREYLRERY